MHAQMETHMGRTLAEVAQMHAPQKDLLDLASAKMLAESLDHLPGGRDTVSCEKHQRWSAFLADAEVDQQVDQSAGEA